MAIKYISKGKAQLIVSVGSTSKGNRRRYTKTVTYKKKKELEKMYQHFEDEVRRNPLVDVTVDGLLEAYISNAELHLFISFPLLITYVRRLFRPTLLINLIRCNFY